MGLKKEYQDTKKFLSNYWEDELSYRILLSLSVGSIILVLFIFSSLIGDLTRAKATPLKTISITFVITLFSFTISNTFPTLYESYKLDVIKTKEKQLVAINKRKLTVVGNTLNTFVLMSIIMGLFSFQNISPIYKMIFIILCLGLFGFICKLAWNHGAKVREKEAQENPDEDKTKAGRKQVGKKTIKKRPPKQ